MSDTVTEEQETAEDVVNDVVDQAQEAQETQQDDVPQEEVQEQYEEEKVPLSALKKVRQEKQEAKIRAEILEKELNSLRLNGLQQNQQQPQVDNSNDLLTVGQQQQTLEEWKRSILEEAYMEQNPDMAERVKHELPEILANPKHKWLADSITQAPNRLQRAAQILDMFAPKKREAAPPPNRSNTPKSPQSVAKTNKLSIADRIMSMSDQELEEWRVSQKRNIR